MKSKLLGIFIFASGFVMGSGIFGDDPAGLIAYIFGFIGVCLLSALKRTYGWAFFYAFTFGAGMLIGLSYFILIFDEGVGSGIVFDYIGFGTIGAAALGGFAVWIARQLRPPTPVGERERAEESKAGFEEEQRRREEERRRREEEQRRKGEARSRYEEEQRRKQEERRRFEEEQRRREEAQARFEQEIRAKETYYDILGVGRNATQDEIKKAYDRSITKCHPDKFFDQPEWIRKDAEQMSKKLNEVYEVLSDPNKRREYDGGL